MPSHEPVSAIANGFYKIGFRYGRPNIADSTSTTPYLVGKIRVNLYTQACDLAI